MDESESSTEGRRRLAVHSKKKLNQTQRNAILGVATVAGLCVVGKLLSVLQKEKPTLQKDKDVETLESVLKEGKTRNLPLQAQVQKTKLANLDKDEPDHEVANGKRNPNRSKYADSFSEIISEDDVAGEGEIYVNQDPMGRRDTSLKPNPKMRDAGHDGRHDLNSLKDRKGKGKQLSVSDGGGLDIKGISHFKAAQNGGNHLEEEDEEEDHQERLSNSSRKRAIKESAKKESTNTTGSSEKLPSTQKGRKTKAPGIEEKAEQKKSKSHTEVGADKGPLFDESNRWESVNDYKVLKASSSKLLPISTEKMEADGHQMKEFNRERAETEKAQSIWDGKVRPRKRISEGSEAYLQIKSSVVSSVSGAEETPEGVKVREVVKRSTLLPIPSGDESEVQSSVYNVNETEEGLTVEEVVTRTKLLPATEGDFSFSDQQLLKTMFRKEPSRQNVWPILLMALQIAAVLATLFSVLLILYSRKRIPLPFF